MFDITKVKALNAGLKFLAFIEYLYCLDPGLPCVSKSVL